MEQQQFKVRLSLGTKLLVSLVSLLVIVIVFLNVSAILLLKEDKRAYTLQSQSTEAVLAGREFVNTSRRAVDTLRLLLGSVDPLKPITPQQTSALQNVIDNQTELPGAMIRLVEVATGKSTPVTQVVREKEFKELQLTPQDLDIPAESLKTIIGEVAKNGYGFINLSRLGGVPVLGVLAADTKLQGNAAGMPLAVGLVSLKDFGSELKGTNLTVATRSGWVLFDTDPTVFFSKKNMGDNPLFAAALTSRLSSGALEYDLLGDHNIGSYTTPGLDLVVLARTEWSKALKATYALTEKFVLLGLMAIGVAVIFAIFFSKTLTAPINRLYQATRQVAQGNFDIVLESKGRDEIAALTGSFTAMSNQINTLIGEKLEKVRLENELAIASTVQQTLIPPPTFRNRNIYIRSRYQAASECGGDWWGFFGVRNKMCLMIADATGHGFPSALITASARSCFSMMAKLASEDDAFSFSPNAMLAYANRVIFDASLSKIMMTFFIGVIDFEAKTFTYSNAGHNPPWLFKKNGEKFQLKSLVAVGQRLGEGRDCPDFEEKSVSLDIGDILFLYTDGLMEGKDLAGEMYGKRRVRSIMESTVAQGPDHSVEKLMEDFLHYNEGKQLDDDVTLAVCEFFPQEVSAVVTPPVVAPPTVAPPVAPPVMAVPVTEEYGKA